MLTIFTEEEVKKVARGLGVDRRKAEQILERFERGFSRRLVELYRADIVRGLAGPVLNWEDFFYEVEWWMIFSPDKVRALAVEHDEDLGLAVVRVSRDVILTYPSFHVIESNPRWTIIVLSDAPHDFAKVRRIDDLYLVMRLNPHTGYYESFRWALTESEALRMFEEEARRLGLVRR
jgi:hypothetical protein